MPVKCEAEAAQDLIRRAVVKADDVTIAGLEVTGTVNPSQKARSTSVCRIALPCERPDASHVWCLRDHQRRSDHRITDSVALCRRGLPF